MAFDGKMDITGVLIRINQTRKDTLSFKIKFIFIFCRCLFPTERKSVDFDGWRGREDLRGAEEGEP